MRRDGTGREAGGGGTSSARTAWANTQHALAQHGPRQPTRNTRQLSTDRVCQHATRVNTDRPNPDRSILAVDLPQIRKTVISLLWSLV